MKADDVAAGLPEVEPEVFAVYFFLRLIRLGQRSAPAPEWRRIWGLTPDD